MGRPTTRAGTGARPWGGEESGREGRQAGIWSAGQGDCVGGVARGCDGAGCELVARRDRVGRGLILADSLRPRLRHEGSPHVFGPGEAGAVTA